MIEMVNVMVRNYGRSLQYEKEEIDMKFEQEDERTIEAEIIGPHLERGCITIAID